MGTFRVQLTVQNVARIASKAEVRGVLVDTGSELTWVSGEVLENLGVKRIKKDMSFVMANGQTITRSIGYAVLHVAGQQTVDEVVFGEKGDHNLLGARTLEGLNLAVDTHRKRLVAAGPILAALARRA